MGISLSLPAKSNISLSDESKNSGIDLSFPSKSNITLSKEAKSSDLKWDDADWTWDSATSSWDAPKLTLNKGETKSRISLSLDSK